MTPVKYLLVTRRCDCGGCESCAPEYHDPEPGEDPYERAAVAARDPVPLLAYELSRFPVDPNPARTDP